MANKDEILNVPLKPMAMAWLKERASECGRATRREAQRIIEKEFNKANR